MMKRLGALIASFVALILVSCAPSMIPATTPGGIIDIGARSLTVTQHDITITVYADAWRYDPIEVRNKFTPFLITVQNNTGQDIIVNEDAIFMFDENNTQYGIVTAENVDRAVVPGYVFPPMVIHGEGGYWYDWWGFGLSAGYPYGRYESDVISTAYRFGPVTARARAHGFIYLQKLPSTARQVKVVITPLSATGKSIPFSFPFAIEQ